MNALVTQQWWNVLTEFHEDDEAMTSWKVSMEHAVTEERGPGDLRWLESVPVVVRSDFSHEPWTIAHGPVEWWHYRLRHTPTV